VIPADTKLAPAAEGHQGLGFAAGRHRRLFARQAEVFAGFLEQTDHEIGRLGGSRR
jgi:arylsulfatase A-like enzyme